MREDYKNHYLHFRIKVSVSKGRKSLIINQAFFSSEGLYVGAPKNSDGGVDIINADGILVPFRVESILSKSENLLEFLKDSHYVHIYGGWHIPKLEGENFDAIIINDLAGYTKAIKDFETVNNQKI